MAQSPREYYEDLLRIAFGAEMPKFPADRAMTSLLTRALQHPAQFNEFSTALAARFERIAAAVRANPSIKADVEKIIGDMAEEKNWAGAYSELITLDFFIAYRETESQFLKLDVTLPVNDTLASELQGRAEANVDGFLELPLKLAIDLVSAHDISARRPSMISPVITRLLDASVVSSMDNVYQRMMHDLGAMSISPGRDAGKVDVLTRPSYVGKEIDRFLALIEKAEKGRVLIGAKLNQILEAVTVKTEAGSLGKGWENRMLRNMFLGGSFTTLHSGIFVRAKTYSFRGMAERYEAFTWTDQYSFSGVRVRKIK